MLAQMNNRAVVSICGMVIDIMRKDHGRVLPLCFPDYYVPVGIHIQVLTSPSKGLDDV